MEGGQIPHTHLPPNSDMDFMDIDEELVVPDTPDRLSRKDKNIHSRTSVSAYSRNSALADRSVFGRRTRSFGGSAQNSVLCSHPFGSSNDVGPTGAGNHVVPSHLFRNAAVSRVTGKSLKLKPQDIHSYDDHHHEDESDLHSRFLGQSHHHKTNNDPLVVEHEEAESSIRAVGDSSKYTRYENKEKVRIGYGRPVGYLTHPQKGNDRVCNVVSEKATGKGLSMPSQSSRLPCIAPRKRLVRNGCISPQNIAKSKPIAGSSANVSVDAGGNELSGGSKNVSDFNEVTAKDDSATRAKGKGVIFPTYSSNGHEGRRSADGQFSRLWRKGKLQETDGTVGQGNCSNSSIISTCSSSFLPAVLRPVPLLNEDQVCTPDTTINKQKKPDSALSILGKSNEVICLSSCGESSTEKSTTCHGGSSHRVESSCSPIAVGELSSEIAETDSQAEARAMQLQLDEMLARELQEQLYNEMPEAAAGELPRGHASTTPRGSHHESEARAARASNTQRHSQSVSFRNHVDRQGPRRRFVPTSSITRIRNRINRSSSLVSPWDRELFFPADMDLDMRMELLEMLEAVFDEGTSIVTQLLDSDREFDENDYETLLALDENNHEHLGASAAQIANLPESTVQNDTFEACSICLETPVIGETIRHLPCLHKFHKGCIDPWLTRRKSCPVCKSDI